MDQHNGIDKLEKIAQQPNDRRDQQLDNKPKKIQKVGHEACLAKVVYERRSVEIIFPNSTIIGEVLEFDKCSIRIRAEDGECAWYFKNAMVGFKEV